MSPRPKTARRQPPRGDMAARLNLVEALQWRINAGLLAPDGIEDSVRCWLSAQGWRSPPPLVQELADLVRIGES